VAPAGLSTRPTADRIKESVFNILGHRVQSRNVLDLFAGTGALGIEALSRGATSAVFIDQAKAALTAIRTNIRNLALDNCARVIQWNISNGLKCLRSAPVPYDLVFMDPPYEIHAGHGFIEHFQALLDGKERFLAGIDQDRNNDAVEEFQAAFGDVNMP
jgi:16S rRNA (guanine966-N2)-methyltransferase